MRNFEQIREKYQSLEPVLNERAKRLWAAVEARAIGRGGITLVAKATGMSRGRISRALAERPAPEANGQTSLRETRIRRPGAGRKRIEQQHPGVLQALEALVEPATRGDPQSPLRWTCKSTYQLAEELQRRGYPVSPRTVAAWLHQMKYSLQSNRKSREVSSHPERNAQFEHINSRVKQFQEQKQPVISVDAKKKELVGDYKNAGREWQPRAAPEKVRVHDFADPELGKVTPYGVYDISHDEGWVSVGIDHDTAEFAVETIRHWWNRMGSHAYPHATELLITADGGGSNGSRTRLWKRELQKLADATGLTISVCHFPPGTSKWNKIEHRLFTHITQNWRGRPLLTHEIIVNLIGHTTTRKGLKIQAQLDTKRYETGIKVSDAEMEAMNLTRSEFHGEWNYQIAPCKKY